MKITSGRAPTTCNTTAVYRIRAFDTTYMIPPSTTTARTSRAWFSENPTNGTVTYHAELWSDGGVHLDTHTVILPPRSLDLWTISGIAVANKTGSVTVTATAGYGELFGKITQMELVSLGGVVNEAWDHPMLPKP